MRPIANFALHSILAAAIVALAASSAAADSFIKLGTPKGEPAAPAGKEKWIEIHSFQWEPASGIMDHAGLYGVSSLAERSYSGGESTGANANTVDIVTVPPQPAPAGTNEKWMRDRLSGTGSVNKVDGFTVKQGSRHVRPVGTSDITMKRGTSPAGSGPTPRKPSGLDVGWEIAEYEAVGGNKTITVDHNRTEGSGASDNLYSFKHQRGPAPPDKFGRVKVQFPWAECRPGAVYEDLTLKTATATYEMRDVTVAACGSAAAPEDISFYYGQLIVK